MIRVARAVRKSHAIFIPTRTNVSMSHAVLSVRRTNLSVSHAVLPFTRTTVSVSHAVLSVKRTHVTVNYAVLSVLRTNPIVSHASLSNTRTYVRDILIVVRMHEGLDRFIVGGSINGNCDRHQILPESRPRKCILIAGAH